MSDQPKLHRIRTWTGPVAVKEVADQLREVEGIESIVAGTEHVVCEVLATWPESPAERAMALINAHYGEKCRLRWLEFKPY